MATVMVVDDSTVIRRILRRALETVGYRVTEASDGREAIAACRLDRPDVVLIDQDMPVMDGMSTLLAMKGDDALRSLPVLFLTARTGVAEVAAALQAGAQDYLRKPCERIEVTARVATALRLQAQERELREQAVRLEELSSIDPLTGLGNRRRLEARAAELAQTAGPDLEVGVLIADVDHFKSVNDTHGHLVGDLVLRILAGRVGGALDDETALVRWGGEEFLALTPGLGADGLCELGERCRAAISDRPFSLGDGRLLPVTVSLGCAAGPLGALDATVRAADEALFAAKRTGRNRVAVSPAPEGPPPRRVDAPAPSGTAPHTSPG